MEARLVGYNEVLLGQSFKTFQKLLQWRIYNGPLVRNNNNFSHGTE
jgi:hypothetical protein